MKPVFIFFLLFIALSLNGKKPMRLENGNYYDQFGLHLIEIRDDTLTLRTWPNYGEWIQESQILAVCQITGIDNNFLEINSIERLYLGAFKDISITYEEHVNNIFPEIVFEVPNLKEKAKFTVSCGTTYYSETSENGKCTIVLSDNPINAPNSFNFTFKPIYYTESDMAGQFFGFLFYWYHHQINIYETKRVVIKLPNVTDNLFEQYYVRGEYVQILPDGVKWKGDIYKRDEKIDKIYKKTEEKIKSLIAVGLQPTAAKSQGFQCGHKEILR